MTVYLLDIFCELTILQSLLIEVVERGGLIINSNQTKFREQALTVAIGDTRVSVSWVSILLIKVSQENESVLWYLKLCKNFEKTLDYCKFSAKNSWLSGIFKKRLWLSRNFRVYPRIFSKNLVEYLEFPEKDIGLSGILRVKQLAIAISRENR